MKLINKYKSGIILVVSMAIIGQIFFALISPGFTTPRYEGRIFSTTGVRHEQEDLHTLNEAAHYFGQTIIGWLKFPNFYAELQKEVGLPDGSSISAHMQERQNIIFSVLSPVPLKQEQLVGVKDYIQKKLDAYNSINRTGFVMTNVDYELVEIKRTYQFGAVVTLIATTVLSMAFLFLKKELLNRK